MSSNANYIALEHHPNDSGVRIAEDDICQTLSSRMGTGGQYATGDGDKRI